MTDSSATDTPPATATATAAVASQPPALAIDGAVATITFRRPATHNRIEPDDVGILRGYLRELDGRADVRVIVFAGEGRTFSSGFDLTRLGTTATTNAENTFELLTDRKSVV